MNGNGNHDSMNLTIIDLFNSEVNFPFHGDGAQLESELSKSSPSLKNATDQETTSSGNTQYDGDAFPSQRGPFKYSATHLSFSSLGFEPDGDDIRNRSLDDAEASSQRAFSILSQTSTTASRMPPYSKTQRTSS